jgi:hypothetical protein
MIKRFQNEIGVILGRNQSSVDKAVDIVTNTYTRSKSYPKLFTFSFECSTIWTEAHATVELPRIRAIRSKQALSAPGLWLDFIQIPVPHVSTHRNVGALSLPASHPCQPSYTSWH